MIVVVKDHLTGCGLHGYTLFLTSQLNVKKKKLIFLFLLCLTDLKNLLLEFLSYCKTTGKV